MQKYKVSICGKEVEINKSRASAIKAHCTDCSAGNRTEVKECPCSDCALFPFRGYIIWTTDRQELTDDEKQVIRDRFQSARQKKE